MKRELYLFYLKDEVSDENRANLYAYTDDIVKVREFKDQRDMNKFIFKKEKVTESEYKNFISRFYSYNLTYGGFHTKGDDLNTLISVKVLCTWREEESILKFDEKLYEMMEKYLFDCKHYKSEYIKALEKIMFIKFYGFYRVKRIEYADQFYQPYYSSFGPVEGLIMENFQESYQIDELRLFLKIYKHTFKKPS